LIASRSTKLLLRGQTGSEDPQEILGELVSDNYFTVLGGNTILGRVFTPEENRTPGQYPLVVLSYGLWQGRFGGDPNILGQIVLLNTKPFVVIGVTAPGFVGLGVNKARMPDLWLPVMMTAEVWPQMGNWFSSREVGFLDLSGRLGPGRTLAEARAEMGVLSRQLAQAYPEIDPQAKGVVVSPLWSLVGRINPKAPLWVVLGGILIPSMIVLLIACSNIANLQLARAAGRASEIGLRICLGASRSRVIRQLLAESVL